MLDAEFTMSGDFKMSARPGSTSFGSSGLAAAANVIPLPGCLLADEIDFLPPPLSFADDAI